MLGDVVAELVPGHLERLTGLRMLPAGLAAALGAAAGQEADAL